jgi:serine/threonine-protein kinase HipA
MHRKNLALLKTAEPGDTQVRSVRMAPLYDAVTTRVFPGLEHNRMALKLSGKDNRLRGADFHAAGATVGVKAAGEGDVAIDEVLARMKEAVGRIALPDLPDQRAAAAAMTMMEKVVAAVRAQLEGFT